ncbi:hypothetical protein [Jeotgalibacillus soli]|uniref:Uncharacterized protein n=1 Tax=Jeotgalibacillus soli TaxID=889306 RepID=A0A0C2S6D4_9BACL|nr:hypothetical protein [Jeotgalibacillus soli]KIL49579.1 hypothetical protein KP78_10470 [Jeotgalibacillus soli]
MAVLAIALIVQAKWVLNLFAPFMMMLLTPYLHYSSKAKNILLAEGAAEKEGRSVLDENEWILKRDSGFFNEFKFVNHCGEYIGSLRPVNVPRWMYFAGAIINRSEQFFSVAHGIFDSHGRPVTAYRAKKSHKMTTLEIRNEHGVTVGFYEEQRYKSLIKAKGVLMNANREVILEASTSSMAGDFNLTDENDRFFASYRHGFFDYAMAEPFKNDQTTNQLVKVGKDLTRDEKVLLAALICYWMRNIY